MILTVGTASTRASASRHFVTCSPVPCITVFYILPSPFHAILTLSYSELVAVVRYQGKTCPSSIQYYTVYNSPRMLVPPESVVAPTRLRYVSLSIHHETHTYFVAYLLLVLTGYGPQLSVNNPMTHPIALSIAPHYGYSTWRRNPSQSRAPTSDH